MSTLGVGFRFELLERLARALKRGMVKGAAKSSREARNAEEAAMAAPENIPDAELIRRLAEGDVAAFETLFRRYDADVARIIEQQLRNVTDREHRAREIADLLWFDWIKHPKYLSRHDPSRRRLSSYLELLARRAARRFLRTVAK